MTPPSPSQDVRSAKFNGVSCLYELQGSGPPLLYLHGGFGGITAPGGVSAEKPWMCELSPHHRVISYDRRSAGPAIDHTMALLAEDACALLDHLGIETTAVWAVSAGCAIGLTLALSRPTRVSALVLSDGAPWFSRDDEMIAALVERLRILETEGAEAAYDARKTLGPVGPRIFSPASLPPSQNESAKLERQRELMRLRLASTSHSERIDGYAAELRTQKAYLGIDFSERLPELTMPLLAVNGTDDQVFPDVGWERFAERMPNLHCLSIEGGIHGCGQSPEAVRAILSFLETASE